ncbi:recombinase XerC [Embleya scabrispora]|uniref:Recombinase XerC n=1 Tax=Embleya scabrispora TaxID=159449 RepID=A0A1T3P766_9ACTN|nr:recombinase XerC [Embleya scabrispora]
MTTGRKSPFRIAAMGDQTHALKARGPVKGSSADARARQLAEYTSHLRTINNRYGRPYAPRTIGAYRDAVIALDKWMTEKKVTGDFTACDTDTLNRFFRWYHREHDQATGDTYTGATNTKQRNLRHLFTWLQEEYDHEHPYTGKGLVRYSAPKAGRPQTLSRDFVGDMLKATGNSSPRVRDFETVRDHAIIRVLTDGVRATELLMLQVSTVLLDQGVAQIVPLKSGRGAAKGRLVPLQPKTVIALRRYLRARETHKLSRSEWLWLGTRGRGHLKYSGLYRMLNRRAEQAGYGAVAPHMFRHTWADDLLASDVSEEDVMEAGGWTDRSMLRRYAADMASSRAVTAVQGLGDRY